MILDIQTPLFYSTVWNFMGFFFVAHYLTPPCASTRPNLTDLNLAPACSCFQHLQCLTVSVPKSRQSDNDGD